MVAPVGARQPHPHKRLRSHPARVGCGWAADRLTQVPDLSQRQRPRPPHDGTMAPSARRGHVAIGGPSQIPPSLGCFFSAVFPHHHLCGPQPLSWSPIMEDEKREMSELLGMEILEVEAPRCSRVRKLRPYNLPGVNLQGVGLAYPSNTNGSPSANSALTSRQRPIYPKADGARRVTVQFPVGAPVRGSSPRPSCAALRCQARVDPCRAGARCWAQGSRRVRELRRSPQKPNWSSIPRIRA